MSDRGRVLAQALARELEPRAAGFRKLTGRPATLAIIAAKDDPAGRKYLELKRDRFRSAGLEVRACGFGAQATTMDVLALLHGLNADPAIDAVFLQFPLPLAVDSRRVADLIAAEKDVDASGATNLGRVLAGTARFLPATPAAVLRLLEEELGGLAGRSVVVVGSGGFAERCLVLLAVTRGSTVCVLAPADPALPDAAAGADAIVIADELPPGDSLRYVRNGAALIDAGYACPPRPRDWLPARALEQLGSYLPQYGNVGPLTVALLMQATLDAARSPGP